LNILGKSNPEDVINIYKSSGTLDDPIQVIGNRSGEADQAIRAAVS